MRKLPDPAEIEAERYTVEELIEELAGHTPEWLCLGAEDTFRGRNVETIRVKEGML